MSYTKETFLKELNENGFVVCESGFSSEYLQNTRKALLRAIDQEARLIGANDYRGYGLLLCSAYYADEYPEFLTFFDNEQFMQPFEWVLDPWYIAYIYSCACIPPQGGRLHTSDIHVDLPRHISGNYHYGLGAILCTDDFTAANGATWILPGSQNIPQKPDEAYFWKNAVRFIAPAGTVCYFNPRIWHAAGVNQTEQWRTSLNVGMSRPWMKQRIDIPRFLDSRFDKDKIIPKHIQQILGYQSQPPASFGEYFAPPSLRSYSQPFV